MVKPTHAMVVLATLAVVGCKCSSEESPEPSPITDDGGTDGGDDGGQTGTQDGGEDAGLQDVCQVGDPPTRRGCEDECEKVCQADNRRGPCQPTGGACLAPLNAKALCLAGGVCGREPCEPGFFDFDPGVPGCETKCTNRTCVFLDGGTVTLSNDPLHERSMVFAALSSGASFGDLTQRSDGGYQNVGTLGEVAVGTSSSDGGYTNYGGFMSVGRGPTSQRR